MEKNLSKNIPKNIQKPEFRFKDRHILWNWELSPNSDDDRKLVRYHFVIVDDKFKEAKIEKIISNFHKKSIANYNFNEVRRVEGKFKDTDFRYLLVSYDSEYSPQLLSFEDVSKNVKRDFNLRERTALNIQDYLTRIYE